MKNKKAMENALLAVIGIGLITTAAVLLLKKSSQVAEGVSEKKHITTYEDYDDSSSDLHVFSETGILL